MKCDLCDEHVDPDDYQEHCEQHHCDGEYDARHPRPPTQTDEWTVLESEDDRHFGKLVSSLGTIATMPRWQAIAIARMHNEALKTYSDELDKLSDSETEQWEAYGARLQKALDESVKLQAHYANLINMHDGGQRRVFKTSDEWIARLEETGTL